MYNTGADVLGILIARASQQRFETFLSERIFEPLGMIDTAFSVPPEKFSRFTTNYWINPATGLREVYDDPKDGQWSRFPKFPSGAAGLVSTVDDCLAFGIMMLNKGEYGNRRILSRFSIEAMMNTLTALKRISTFSLKIKAEYTESAQKATAPGTRFLLSN